MNKKKIRRAKGTPVVWRYPYTVCDINPYMVTLKRKRSDQNDSLENVKQLIICFNEAEEEMKENPSFSTEESIKKEACKHMYGSAKQSLVNPCNSTSKLCKYCMKLKEPSEDQNLLPGGTKKLICGECLQHRKKSKLLTYCSQGLRKEICELTNEINRLRSVLQKRTNYAQIESSSEK